MYRSLALLLLALVILISVGCDDFSHDGIINTPPPNYINLLMTQTHGGDTTETWNSLRVRPDNGFAVVGTTNTWGNGLSGGYLVSLSASGGVLWQQILGGFGRDHGHDLLLLNDGGYLVVGGTSSFDLVTQEKPSPINNPFFNFLDQNLLVVRTDDSGRPLWQHAFGDSLIQEWATSVASIGSSILVAGVTDRGDANAEVVVARVNLNGEQQWLNRYNVDATNLDVRIVSLVDGNFALVGHGRYASSGKRTPFAIRIDEAGAVLSERTYGWITSHEEIHAAIPVSNGFIACGSSLQNVGTENEAELLYVVKVSLGGQPLWQYTYEQTGIEEGRGIVEKPDGSLIICGQNTSIGGIDVAKLTSEGLLQWSDATGVTGESTAMAASSQGYAIAGYTLQASSATMTDGLLLEFREDLTNIP